MKVVKQRTLDTMKQDNVVCTGVVLTKIRCNHCCGVIKCTDVFQLEESLLFSNDSSS